MVMWIAGGEATSADLNGKIKDALPTI